MLAPPRHRRASESRRSLTEPTFPAAFWASASLRHHTVTGAERRRACFAASGLFVRVAGAGCGWMVARHTKCTESLVLTGLLAHLEEEALRNSGSPEL